MDDRKRKGITEDGTNDSPKERARKARETRRAAAAPYARDREDGNPGQNAPPPRLVNNETHGGLPMGQQQPDAVVLGGDTSRTGAQGQATAAQGSGNLPPRTKVCPMCHNSSIFSDEAMCVRCASKIAAKASVRPGLPPLPPRRQQQPHGLHRSPSSPANLAFVTNRPIEQQQVRGPSVIQNPRPGLLQGAPQAQPVPRAGDVKQQPVLIPGSGWQPPPAVSDGGLQRLRRHMAELDAGSRPVGEHGGGERRGLSAAQIGLPDLQKPPQAHPETRADMPVGRHKDPIVPGSGPAIEDGWCPACRYYPARKLLQPREHDCVCLICRYVDGIVCAVCSSA